MAQVPEVAEGLVVEAPISEVVAFACESPAVIFTPSLASAPDLLPLFCPSRAAEIGEIFGPAIGHETPSLAPYNSPKDFPKAHGLSFQRIAALSIASVREFLLRGFVAALRLAFYKRFPSQHRVRAARRCELLRP